MQSRRDFLAASLAATAAPSSIEWLTLEQAAGEIRRKAVSPLDLTRMALARIERLNPKLNAFITVTADEALDQAREAEREIRAGRYRGPLHGIPVALKDLYDTAGVRTTCASEHYANRIPKDDAAAVARLKSAGAVLVGKTNMDEFAYNFTSETSFYGAARNPWDLARTPGGSSGGSAIAVAAGLCYAALGSDTGGSIRLPAALCGVTGLKPTYGLIDLRGVAPLAWSLDHAGPFCRTARAAALVLGALAEPAKTPLPNIKSVRLGIPAGFWFENIDPAVAEAFNSAAQHLAKLTAGLRKLPALPIAMSPQLPDLPAAYITIIQAEAYTFHKPLLDKNPAHYNPGTRRSIENGAGLSAAAYIEARREMERLRAASSEIFKEADVILTPTAPAPAFKLGDPAGLIFLRNTAPWNLLGLPAISIPCGFTKEGLPLGLQITAAAGRDRLALALAEAYQQSTNWHTRRPNL
jgi:aspartyl-tRNA(Asn)/glutamyl-tRNA(Gln) amidotransferase subunit A